MKLRARRLVLMLVAFLGAGVWVVTNPASYEVIFTKVENDGANYATSEVGPGVEDGGYGVETGTSANASAPLAIEILEKLEIKGRAPNTGYKREEFYSGWPTVDGCSLRQRIIKREFGDTAVLDGCNVVAGEFDEPYTGEHRVFTEKTQIYKIQIDHVVALSDAWQKGARYMEKEVRYKIATDPLNLLAVDGPANEQKSDGDAATWLPANKKFRCQYVARQVSVKYRYGLWVTEAEKAAIAGVLANCPNERVISL